MRNTRILRPSPQRHDKYLHSGKSNVGTLIFIFIVFFLGAPILSLAANPQENTSQQAAHQGAAPSSEAASLGLTFVPGSSSTVIVERDGKKYLVDLASHTVRQAQPDPSDPAPAPAPAAKKQLAKTVAAPQKAPAATSNQDKTKRGVYEAGDDYLFTLPTGRRLDKHGFYVNFNHRFGFDPAFSGPARGAILGGLDGFGIASFGLRYGVTDKLSVSAYRSPSVIGRPIQFMAGYNLMDEHDGKPFNTTFRVSVEGRDNFRKDYTVNFEGIVSRSITKRAQIYAVPTVSLADRRLLGPQLNLTDSPPDLPGVNTFSLGVGASFDIRPTVALVAEVIPTLVNGRDLGIHRPAFSFGIQKKIWRHAFTFGFSNSPGTTVSQRAGTRATFIGDPSGDTPAALFIGFDITRQIY